MHSQQQKEERPNWVHWIFLQKPGQRVSFLVVAHSALSIKDLVQMDSFSLPRKFHCLIKEVRGGAVFLNFNRRLSFSVGLNTKHSSILWFIRGAPLTFFVGFQLQSLNLYKLKVFWSRYGICALIYHSK